MEIKTSSPGDRQATARYYQRLEDAIWMFTDRGECSL